MGESMKAIVYYHCGPPDVLRCEEIAKPSPSENEVLIKVRTASINALDRHLMRGGTLTARLLLRLLQPGMRRPGVDVAGEVAAVGKNVKRFRPGDAVFGVCKGAFAEYACAPESKIVPKSQNVTFEQAASAPIAGLTALQGLRDHGRLQSGQRVLVNGAGGGVGTFAVQIAKAFGANVTGVSSTANQGLMRSIGADQVIDYTKEDFTRTGQRYDLIFDCYANHSFSAIRHALNPKGIYVAVGAPPSRWTLGVLVVPTKAAVSSAYGSQRFKVYCEIEK